MGGVQVVDLNQLLTDTPCTETPEITPVTRFTGGTGPALTSSHNIFVNEDTGYAYVVGGGRGYNCIGGLYILDLNEDASDPQFEACFEEDGYTHDVQCVLYNGPDAKYVGRELCFACNEDTVTIVDVTDKSDMTIISRTSYPTMEFTHQGWLTEDHAYFIFGDEHDEGKGAVNKTTTYVANVMELESVTITSYEGRTKLRITIFIHSMDTYTRPTTRLV